MVLHEVHVPLHLADRAPPAERHHAAIVQDCALNVVASTVVHPEQETGRGRQTWDAAALPVARIQAANVARPEEQRAATGLQVLEAGACS